jgi:trigger factor
VLKSIEDISTTKKRLKIEIPSEAIEKEIDDSLEKLKQKAKIPGFRPGKAPVTIIEKRFGKGVEAEVLDRIIPEYYGKALQEAQLTPVSMPVFDEKIDFKRKLPLHLSFTIEVMPKIENLQYENIKIKDIPVNVDDAEIEEYLNRLQREKAVYEVADKEIETDDMVSVEYVDCAIAGEDTSPSLKEQISKMGNEILPPDIIEKMVGKKKGDIVEVTTTINTGSLSKELAGKEVSLKVVITEIKKKNLPAIDDEFAKDLGFETLSEMKEKIKERMYALKTGQVAKIQKAKIIDHLIASYPFDAPESLAQREIESLMMEKSLYGAGYKKQDEEHLQEEQDALNNTPEDLLTGQESGEESASQENEEEKEKLKQRALSNVRASLLIDMIGNKEGVTVSADEIKERISRLARRLSSTPEAIVNFYKQRDGSLDGLKHAIFEDKTLDLLLSKAVIEKGD